MKYQLRPSSKLKALGHLFRLVVKGRNFLFDKKFCSIYQSSLPVISVGNIVAGGSGKTPFCDYLALKLSELGRKPVILSRGYGGTLQGPLEVKKGALVAEVGDEALLHLQETFGMSRVVIARKRAEGARLIEQQNLGDVIILDDGFQHRPLYRDVDIVLLDVSTEDAINKWAKGALLPAGYLREPLEDSLQRASFVGLVDKQGILDLETASKFTQLLPKEIRWFLVQYRYAGFRDICGGEQFNCEEFTGKEVTVFTAIADPQSLVERLERLKIKVKRLVSFPDHYCFSAKDVEALANAEPIIVTGKDSVKLSHHVNVSKKFFEIVISCDVQGSSASDMLPFLFGR